MNREESIALFEKCEAARKEALDSGKTEDEAHNVAKGIWNNWAESLLKEKDNLKEQGLWKNNKDSWHKRAQVNFASLCFLKYEEKLKEAAQGRKYELAENKEDAKSIFFLSTKTKFENYIFPSNAYFEESTFSSDADFRDSTFGGYVDFRGSTFNSDADFRDSTFRGYTDFRGSTFSSNADFRDSTFRGYTDFEGSTFSSHADFRGSTFRGDAYFKGSTFSSDADFRDSTFRGYAEFRGSAFRDYADFTGSTFSSYADFRGNTFSGYTDFEGSTFCNDADFRGSNFKNATTFSTSTFKSAAYFYSMQSDVSFDLSDTIFHTVPNFLEARFKNDEPPNLDNVQVRSQPLWTCGYSKDSELVTKFRKLKKMSFQAHYNEGELEFHAQELRSNRFKTWQFKLSNKDFTLPIPLVWKTSFWLSLAYGTISDFGRSIMRPIAAWIILVIVFAGIYLSQTPSVERVVSGNKGNTSYLSATWQAFKNDQECAKPKLIKPENREYKLLSHTNAPQEALYLSIKNSFVFIDWDRSEAALRTFGCLYGLQETKTSLVPKVPFWISFANIIQNILSAMLIFLFGLGLRNMLKLK